MPTALLVFFFLNASPTVVAPVTVTLRGRDDTAQTIRGGL